MAELVLRYSAIEDCTNPDTGCPRRVYHSYILGKKKKSTSEADEGTAAHEVVRRWHLQKRELHLELAVLEECIKFETLRKENADEVLIMVKGFIKRFNPDGPEAKVYLEHKLQVKMAEFLLTGTPDYLAIYPDYMGRISDYKTGRLKQVSNQLKFYGWLAHIVHKVKQIHGEKFYLRDGTIGGQVLLKEDDFKAIGKWVWQSINQIKAMLDQGEKGFPPNPNPFCCYCPVADDCPVLPQKLEDLNKMTMPDDIKKKVEYYLIYEARLKLLESFFRKYTEENGIVEECGSQIGYFMGKSSKTIEDIEAFFKLLKEHGFKPKDVLRPEANELKKLLTKKAQKAHPEFWAALQPLLIEKPPSKSFSCKISDRLKETTAS